MEVLYVQAMLKYKLAIFDLDGTLSDSFPWFLRVINSVADKHGFRRVEDHDIDTLRGKSSREIVKFMNVPYWRLPAIARDVRRMKSEALTDIPLFPGVDRMLRKLSDKGVVLAVVSSNSESNVRTALGDNAGLMSHYACGASLFGKAANFKATLKKAGIAASHAICIGDEVRDGEAAHKARIAFGAVSWGYAKVEALRKVAPVTVFQTVEDIVSDLT